MIQAGTHQAKATDARLGFANTGNEQVAVRFELTDTGERVTWYGYFSERAIDTTLRALRACGWKGDDLSDMSTIGDEDVELVVEHEVNLDTGKTFPRVRWVTGISSPRIKLKHAMDEQQRREFAERLRGKVAAKSQLDPTAVAQPAAKEAEDDFTF